MVVALTAEPGRGQSQRKLQRLGLSPDSVSDSVRVGFVLAFAVSNKT